MERYYAPDFRVDIAGLTLQADVTEAVMELSYDNSVETADMFTLRLNNAGQRLTDSALFDVGKRVELHMGYAGELRPMMLGEIAAVSPSFPSSGPATLTVTGYDKSHRLRHNTPERFTFKYMNDSAIAAQIAAENLLIPVVDPAPTATRESVQQTASDWAFLSELADRNYFEVRVWWDQLYFRFPRPQTEMVRLEWGKNLSSFSPRLSTSGQAAMGVVRGYDYKLGQAVVAMLPMAAAGAEIEDVLERLGSSVVEQLAAMGRYVIRDQSIENMYDAAAVAKSMLLQLLEGLTEGSGTCIGIPNLKAGDMIDIAGVGKRFSGKYRLAKVTHTINESGYMTNFEVSQRHTGTLLRGLRTQIGETPSPTRQDLVNGPVIGKVENNIDPDNLGRVQLSFPHLSDVNLSAWARIATPMAGSTEGIYFLPDKGDEVVVVFEGGHIDKPIVVGALWSGVARPPLTNSGLNQQKVIKVGPQMQILFDTTPGAEKVQIKANEANFVEVSTMGVKLKGTTIELN
jgi:phage protein D